MYHEVKNARFALLASRFNKEIVDKLVAGAQGVLLRYDIESMLFWVPGAFEIPLMAKQIALTAHFDAIICLGAIIRGETAHFDHVAMQASSGILQSSLETNIPMIFSILTTNTIEQAKERAQEKGKNEGARGALTALEMVYQLRKVHLLCDLKNSKLQVSNLLD